MQKLIFPYILFLFYLNLLSCEDELPRATAPRMDILSEIQPDQISWNIKVTFVDSNYVKAILYATRARVFQERMETLIDSGLKVDFFSMDEKQRISYLVAEKARIDDRTKDMFAEGNVVVISEKTGRKLETQILSWNNSTQRFYSTEFVKITTPEEIIQGYGFESDANLSNYNIHKVSGVKQ